VSPILSRMKHGANSGGRPSAAIELTPDGVLAAALPGRNESPVYAFEALRPGMLVPGISEVNMVPPEAVSSAIRAALGSVAPRTRAVTIVVPDSVVRVFVLDFDSLPARATEAVPVLRFRLRKMVPFDVEHAGVSYQILSQSKTECRVLVAVLPNNILEEYEGAVRTAGYEPGAVIPSTLAALAAMDMSEPILAACLSRASITTSITIGDDLLLYRTIDLPEDPNDRLLEVQRSIAVAAAYYEDKISVLPKELYFSGNGPAKEFEHWFGPSDLKILDLAPRPEKGAATTLGEHSFAGITGALVGAA
jgi:type IV pilus assembly protein PilM